MNEKSYLPNKGSNGAGSCHRQYALKQYKKSNVLSCERKKNSDKIAACMNWGPNSKRKTWRKGVACVTNSPQQPDLYHSPGDGTGGSRPWWLELKHSAHVLPTPESIFVTATMASSTKEEAKGSYIKQRQTRYALWECRRSGEGGWGTGLVWRRQSAARWERIKGASWNKRVMGHSASTRCQVARMQGWWRHVPCGGEEGGVPVTVSLLTTVSARAWEKNGTAWTQYVSIALLFFPQSSSCSLYIQLLLPHWGKWFNNPQYCKTPRCLNTIQSTHLSSQILTIFTSLLTT